jgi:hypothetical protein
MPGSKRSDKSTVTQAAEKRAFEGVILSAAKDLLFVRM